ncbi:epidermal growth factor receptor kinase substrate 8-like protein 3 [Rhinophrynus dorsalis]
MTTTSINFQHRVEHLLTCDLDNDLRSVEDCLKRLSSLDSEGRVWGQSLILQVNDGELLLNDPETRDSLDRIPLDTVGSCSAVLGRPIYNSLLTVNVQSPQKSSIFLFQCDDQPADVLQANLEKAVKQLKGNRDSRDNFRNNLENSLSQNHFIGRNYSPPSSVGWESPKMEPMNREIPRDSPIPQRRFEPLQNFCPPSPGPPRSFNPSPVSQVSVTEHDIEILNHTLGDIELFIGKITTSKKKKKGKSAEPEFLDCFQKIKFAFNLLGKVHDQMQQPSAPDLVHMIMDILPKIISKCPKKDMAQSVVSPLLTQKALLLMSSCVTDKEKKLWDSLGDAWMRTRADWPNGKNLPPYVPIFSDGWIPPDMPFDDGQPQSLHEAHSPPTNRHFDPLIVQVLHDFEARNSRELSVRKGDSVKVLDQSKQWWLVQNSVGQKGYIPSNIVDNGDDDEVPVGSVTLQPSSRPEEVKAWLQQRGFSNITVRCLGVLRGQQLLELSREDLKAVCPEEGGRVYMQLSTVRGALGI